MSASGTLSVLFAMPPGGVAPGFSEHLGTAFLRAMLARADIHSEQYVPRRNVSLPAFARFLLERRPAIVGFTAYETNLRACRAMARVVHESLPEAIVLVGGPNATFSPEETLELLRADACLRGAGEGTISGIAEAILGSDAPRSRLPDLLDSFPNLLIRTGDGAHRTRAGDISSFPGEHFRTLDDIPSPYQDGLVSTPEIGILTARGCNQHCTYCSYASISGRRVHYHGVERVLADLAALKALVDRAERQVAAIPIFDDAFSLAPERARAICEGILARGLQMPLECLTRADRVDASLLRLMRRAGFVGISFGLESAVPRVLRTIGKVQDPETRDDPGFERERSFLERCRRSVAAAKEAELSPRVSIISGLPGETAEDLRETLAFVDSLSISGYEHNELALLPGTPLYRDRERHALAAERDATSGLWRTKRSFDVRSVKPLRTSSLHQERWVAAHDISDALCGVPRPKRASDDAAWAIVVHREPDARLAAWLADVLAVHGLVVAVDTRRSFDAGDRDDWVRTLAEAEVPAGLLALLSREGAAPLVLRSTGTVGEHRFELSPEWRPGSTAAEADDAGNCRVVMWIASGASRAPPPARALLSPTLQIADGCRWWSGWRRCRRPGVLHVDASSKVRPCWHGPEIGEVGDCFGDLCIRARALTSSAEGGGDRCPLGKGAHQDPDEAYSAERLEIASQWLWSFRGLQMR